MTINDRVKYWTPAANNLFGDTFGYEDTYHHDRSYMLDKALGVSEFRDYLPRDSRLDTSLPEELKMLLEKLAGPHGKAILKAYRIQKGLE